MSRLSSFLCVIGGESLTHELLCYTGIAKLLNNEVHIVAKKQIVLNLLEIQAIVLPNMDHSNGTRCHDIRLEVKLKGNLLRNIQQNTVTCDISTGTKVRLGEEWTEVTVHKRRSFESDGCLNFCCPLVRSSDVHAHCLTHPELEVSIKVTLYPRDRAIEARVDWSDEEDMVIVESLCQSNSSNRHNTSSQGAQHK